MYSYYKILATCPMLYNTPSSLFLRLVVCTFCSSTPYCPPTTGNLICPLHQWVCFSFVTFTSFLYFFSLLGLFLKGGLCIMSLWWVVEGRGSGWDRGTLPSFHSFLCPSLSWSARGRCEDRPETGKRGFCPFLGPVIRQSPVCGVAERTRN